VPLNRRVPRLPPENYLGSVPCFITICTDLRRPHLAGAEFASRVVGILKECAASTSFLLHAYCVMPDHMHILAEGGRLEANVLQFVRIFKIRTAFEFRKARKLRLWEKSFYDHILRRADAVEDVASYIWWNPVRKNLCSKPSEFAFSGSETISWMQRSTPQPTWAPPWKAKEPI